LKYISPSIEKKGNKKETLAVQAQGFFLKEVNGNHF
jgi:hypothetical protein